FKPTPKIPSRHHPSPHAASYDEIPKCASNTSSPWCLEDNDYPTYEVQEAAQKNSIHLLKLYADAADTNTANSADGPDALGKETHLCTSHSSYVRPLRAMNVDGDWRVIVNVIKVNYEDLTQTVRLEECEEVGQSCPLVPKCYASTCIQTFIYHRFLVYDPSDIYFPFTIESFKLPASCSCILDSF
ncbi:Spaetzle, partial [Trinorchestia longiramus]